ncbi:MAG: hypothetical protein CSA63_01130 [Propionibacterium sp.]|nr:MAG: hypothetical protein CSA63_01130 [Propionibacterium sp.]
MVAVGVLVSLLLTACAGSGEPGESVSPTGVTPFPTATPFPTSTPAPTPTPTPAGLPSFPPAPADEDDTTAAIRAGFEAYWQAYDAALKDPLNEELAEATQQVTEPGSEEAEAILQAIQLSRDRDGRTVGNFVFRDVVVSEPTAADDGTRTATVTYCSDATGISLVSISTGEKMDVTPIPTLLETMTLAEGTDGIWRVSMMRNKEATC